MTLKRYQPVRRRKRPSKKNRPLKMVLAVGVVGVAAGLAYLSLHGEMLVGLLDGSFDLPDHRFRAAAAAPATSAPTPKPRPTATPMARLRTNRVAVAASPMAPSSVPSAVPASVAPLHAAAPAQPSAFPEDGRTAPPANVMADATVLKPSGVASFAPRPASKPTPAPVAKAVAKPAPAPVKPSPVAIAKATPTPKPVVAVAHPSPAPKVAVKPKPKPVAGKPVSAPRAVAAAAGRGGSLYFDKNSSYLSAAEKDRLANLVDAIARRGGTIHVAGYADAVGDVSYSRWIAGRRASRVADLIRARAAGKVKVVVDAIDVVPGGAAADGEAKNRRVEIQVK